MATSAKKNALTPLQLLLNDGVVFTASNVIPDQVETKLSLIKDDEKELGAQFPNELMDIFRCAICRNVLRKATCNKLCMHRFCKSCIELHVQRKTNSACPVCRNHVPTRRAFEPDQYVAELIEICTTFAHRNASNKSNEIRNIAAGDGDNIADTENDSEDSSLDSTDKENEREVDRVEKENASISTLDSEQERQHIRKCMKIQRDNNKNKRLRELLKRDDDFETRLNSEEAGKVLERSLEQKQLHDFFNEIYSKRELDRRKTKRKRVSEDTSFSNFSAYENEWQYMLHEGFLDR